MGRRLTSGSRPVGRSTPFRCVGGGGVSKRGKGGSGPSSPSSLPLSYIKVEEAYASGGGRGQDSPSPPPTILASSINTTLASFVQVKPKEEGCRWGNRVFGGNG